MLVKTLLDGEIDVDRLSDKQRSVWDAVEAHLGTRPKFHGFAAFWRTAIQKVLPGYPKSIRKTCTGAELP